MAFTDNYAILNDCPLFWLPEALAVGKYVSRFQPELPTRLGVIPRRGTAADIQWFEASPTYVLHWTNAYEDGDEIVLDGFFQDDPMPADDGAGSLYQRLFRSLAADRLQTRLHRWRLNLVTGAVTEQRLTDSITEFGVINSGCAGRPYRYTWAATGKPAWFLFDGLVRHDLATGTEERLAFGDGVYGSEAAMAPRSTTDGSGTDRTGSGGTGAEDDGYLITLTTDMNADASYCLVLDAARVADGPVCTLKLPERIASGTHSTWADGAELRRWRTADTAAEALRL
jgi:carotenoid cleavage dioxygenase